MIFIRNNKNGSLEKGSFFNRTCAYMHLKSINAISNYDIVDINYYARSKGNKKWTGPFDDKEAISAFMFLNGGKQNVLVLKTTKVL